MKVGVKIWPNSPEWPNNEEYALEIAEHADFIEIMAKRGCDFAFLKDIDLPFVVHAEHSGLGVNPADGSKLADSRDSLAFAQQLADRLDARAIILHPGYFDGGADQSLENVISFLRDASDKRLLLENLLARENMKTGVFKYPFSTPEKMKALMEATGMGLCLDFSHVNVAASFLGLDYMELLGKFMELKPRHFHACGGIEGKPVDMHMHLWEGNLKIEAYKRMLPKTAWVTLETPTDLEGQIKDIGMMRK